MNQLENITAYAGDIHEHLPALSKLASECSHVTEMGVRHCVSTWAFVDGLQHKGGRFVAMDIVNPPEANLKAVQDKCKELGIDFEFILGDTLRMEIEETDLLFIDTVHTARQLLRELIIHADRARKYIVLHDTESCKKELWPVVEKFAVGKWKVKEHYENCNGLTVLEKV
jgi:hypothetical protein